MTNREIEKHKNSLAEILTELRYESKTSLDEYMLILANGIKKLQELSEVVDARKYMGFGLRDMDSMLEIAKTKQLEGHGSLVFKKKCDEYELICKEMSDNIVYKLQTEMMFNACVSAKWSCLCAAVAAIAACISIGLTWWLN